MQPGSYYGPGATALLYEAPPDQLPLHPGQLPPGHHPPGGPPNQPPTAPVPPPMPPPVPPPGAGLVPPAAVGGMAPPPSFPGGGLGGQVPGGAGRGTEDIIRRLQQVLGQGAPVSGQY